MDYTNKQYLTLSRAPLTEDIKVLDVYGNRLTHLKGCPDTVISLDCSKNRLNTLEGCPNSVKELKCSFNKLRNLNHCPESVVSLVCSNNKDLFTLRGISPNVEVLNCCNNPNLRDISALPVKIIDLTLSGCTNVKFFPNTIKNTLVLREINLRVYKRLLKSKDITIVKDDFLSSKTVVIKHV